MRFVFQMTDALPHQTKHVTLIRELTNSRHSTICRNMVNKVMFICRKCPHKKTVKYLLVITSANIFSRFNYNLIVLNEKYVYLEEIHSRMFFPRKDIRGKPTSRRRRENISIIARA